MTNNKIVIPVPRSENYGEWTFKAILFLLWPFGAFLYSLRDAASKSSYVIYFLFGVLFCWHMNPTGVERFDDLIGIMKRVIESNYSWSDIGEQIISYFSFSDDGAKELYENFLICLSKTFTPNPHLFFALASIPYLVFMLKSLKQITTDEKFDSSIYGLLILALFVMPRDIITVQNPRFTTAVWIVVYATIKFYQQKSYSLKYFAFIVVTPLIHSAFWFYVLVFIGGLVLRRFPSITIWLLYLSVPFSYMSYDILSGLDYSFMPSSIRVWTEGYLDEDHYNAYVAHTGASGFYWVQQVASIYRNTVYLIIPLFLWRIKDKPAVKRFGDLFRYYIYFFAVVNFIQVVPVLGERFMWIVQILSLYLFFKIIYPKHKILLWLLISSWVYFAFRRYFYGGALSSSVPLEIFYMPAPTLIADFW